MEQVHLTIHTNMSYVTNTTEATEHCDNIICYDTVQTDKHDNDQTDTLQDQSDSTVLTKPVTNTATYGFIPTHRMQHAYIDTQSYTLTTKLSEAEVKIDPTMTTQQGFQTLPSYPFEPINPHYDSLRIPKRALTKPYSLTSPVGINLILLDASAKAKLPRVAKPRSPLKFPKVSAPNNFVGIEKSMEEQVKEMIQKYEFRTPEEEEQDYPQDTTKYKKPPPKVTVQPRTNKRPKIKFSADPDPQLDEEIDCWLDDQNCPCTATKPEEEAEQNYEHDASIHINYGSILDELGEPNVAPLASLGEESFKLTQEQVAYLNILSTRRKRTLPHVYAKIVEILGEKVSDILALIDTGASDCLISLKFLKQL